MRSEARVEAISATGIGGVTVTEVKGALEGGDSVSSGPVPFSAPSRPDLDGTATSAS